MDSDFKTAKNKLKTSQNLENLKSALEKFYKFISHRMTIVIALIILQILFLSVFFLKLSEYFAFAYILTLVVSAVVVIMIINSRENPIYKLAYIIPVLALPVFGCLFYLVIILGRRTLKFKGKMEKEQEKCAPFLKTDDGIIDEIRLLDRNVANQSRYIKRMSGYPAYKNTETYYLTPGETMFEKMKEELRKAKEFIFLEFFIVSEGFMWDSILEILLQKVMEGVEVRLMYDDMGSIYSLPPGFDKKVEEMGIKCLAFNPVSPKISPHLNNRDHRKIVVIDGKVAFTGGINLADEYINAYPKHGHWKDAGIMLKGEAVLSFTLMFLQMWNASRPTDTDYGEFLKGSRTDGIESDGYVQPYADNPLDDHLISENIYLNIINKAKDYLYINTPYLIPDNEMITALCIAAQNGLDVRIVTPHKGDKWYVHLVTRSNYRQLVEAGVKIYEYSPGFIHSKTFLADDELATIGTPNLDCRSLYMHFECGVWMYRTRAVKELKEDFLATLDDCMQIGPKDFKSIKIYVKILQCILRIFAPLL